MGLIDAIGSGLGYLGDALNKPGRAVRGLLGGRPEEALAAIPFSDSMGITNPSNAVSGKELFGTDSDIGGFLGELATDPMTLLPGGWLAGRASKAAVSSLKGALESPGVANLLPLRREFTMVKDAHVPMNTNVPIEGRRIGGNIKKETGSWNVGRLNEVDDTLRNWHPYLDDNSHVAGMYDPGARMGIVRNDLPDGGTPYKEVLRHENVHGILDMASESGRTAGLTPLMRATIAAEQSRFGPIRALGDIGDELTARVAGNKMSFPHAWSEFMMNPYITNHYANYVANNSPLIASLYGEGMLGRLPIALGVMGGSAAAAGGTAALISAIENMGRPQ